MRKLIFLLIMPIFLFTSCNKEELIIEPTLTSKTESALKTEKVDVCHYDADTDTWKTLNINGNALKAHLNHGDYEGDCKIYTYVPDDSFEQRLIDLGYDDVLDDYVLTSNINTVTRLSIGGRDPAYYNLTGIEDFVSLTILEMGDLLDITELDLSHNKDLRDLSLEHSPSITDLDLSQNTNLIRLRLENISITDLDLSQNKALQYLDIDSMPITDIDLSQHTDLRTLSIGPTLMTGIDVSQNTNLEELSMYFWPNNIYNKILSLDVSNNPNLLRLYLRWNPALNSLNLKNGNNSNLRVEENNNTSLTCVEVDVPLLGNSGFESGGFGAGITFSDDCQQTQPIQIGYFYQGGIVFETDGTHGKIASPYDLGEFLFGCEYGSWDDSCGDQPAIDACTELELNGYSDWYLPNHDELREVFYKRDIIDATAILNGGEKFNQDEAYWDSDGHYRYFFTGFSNKNYVDAYYNVRPIRAF